MRLKNVYMPTLREVPASTTTKSQQLLMRAAMIRRAVSGAYSYLPLGMRIVEKIERVVRNAMDESGVQEVWIPRMQAQEQVEETLTALLRGEITSYKQLPLRLYQIQTQYFDENIQPPLRNYTQAKIEQNAYSIDKDTESVQTSHEKMREAYRNVFSQLALDYKLTPGTIGTVGDNQDESFIAMADGGEDVVVHCDDCNFAASEDKAPVNLKLEKVPAADAPVDIHTPGATTIADVSSFLKKPSSHCAKAIDLMVSGKPVFLFVPGDRELNLTKAAAFLQTSEDEIEMMDGESVYQITGSEPGYTGPVGLSKAKARIIIDRSLTEAGALVVGANRTEYHKTDVVYGRDFTAEVAEDLLMIEENDPCPSCGGKLNFDRGIEVGNIFQFGAKYSEPMGATFLDENGKAKPFLMGSYGIGITRSVTAVVEQNVDDAGIVWPMVVAPYHVIVTIANMKDETAVQEAEALYARLREARVEVVLDDRNERAGVKFNDRDLIGFPIRVTVGKKAGEGIVEYSLRKDRENEEITIREALQRILDKTEPYRN